MLELTLTFAWLRVLNWAALRLLPQAWVEKQGLLAHTATAGALSTIAALSVIAAAAIHGVAPFSPAAAIVSIAVDAAWLVAACCFHRRLRRGAANPQAHHGAIWLLPSFGGSSAFWWVPDTKLQIVMAFLPFSFMTILFPRDFYTCLGGDLRRINATVPLDEFQQPPPRDWTIAPHIAVLVPESASVAQRAPFLVSTVAQIFGQRHHAALNRWICGRLTAAQWMASRRLTACAPVAIAWSWKTFYFQPGLRLRFVSLFNATEMLLRLTAAVVLSTLRSAGVLVHSAFYGDRFLGNGSFGDWRVTLANALAVCTPALDAARATLLDHDPAFDGAIELLSPFWQVLGRAPSTGPRSAMDGFQLLGELRNNTLGHGAIGHELELDAAPFIDALHRFFLTTVSRITEWDLVVRAVRPDAEDPDAPLTVVGRDAGLDPEGEFPADTVPVMSIPGLDRVVSLYPYLVFRNARLLFLRRVRKTRSEYFDFEPSVTQEPVTVVLPTTPAEFAEPRDPWSPPCTPSR